MTAGRHSRTARAGRLLKVRHTVRLVSPLLAALCLAVSAPARQYWVYFGTYPTASSRGIYVSRLDAATGSLARPALAAESLSPSYLAVSPDHRCLYAANEVEQFKDYATDHGGAVSAFSVDAASGGLTFLNQWCSSGSDPCHVSVDPSGRVLFAANYGSGSVKAFLLATNGAIAAGGDCVSRGGHSVNPTRQTSAHAHFICADPSDRFALSCDLGTDEVIVYPLDLQAAGLHPAKTTAAEVPAGSGPRHLVFSRDGRFVHVLNELGCTISTFSWDSAAGTLHRIETVSALPPKVAVEPDFTAAEILTAGTRIYATIRGHDSVSVFSADAATGRLKFIQNVPSHGKVPRGMGIDPTARWLLVSNQGSGKVVEFSISPETGELSATSEELAIGSPVDVKFVEAR